MKVLIIGLDGATWNVLDDYLLENYMPNLNKLKNQGCWGILRSTEPPASPIAWTSFLTGCNPGKHGVTGFHYYSMKDNTLGIQNSTHCRVTNMYQQLSRQGYKIISINVPWTYPCYEINGIMVAGLGFGGIESEFTYPSSFKDELLEKLPNYDFSARSVKGSNRPDNFKQVINKIQKSFQQRIEAVKLANEKVDWDIMVVQFHDTDGMNHCAWKYVSSDTRDQYRQYRDEAFRAFKALDESIGELLNMVKSKDSAILIISDHGGDRLSALIRANLFLEEWGYLKLRPKWEKSLKSMVKSLKKRLGILIKRRPVQGFAQKQPDKLNIDFKKSKAFVIHTAIPSGHIYLNLKDRNPNGVVEPGQESERLIEELKKTFLSVKDSSTDKPLFSHVVTPAELYGGDMKGSERIGDLILIPRQGYELTSSTSKRKGPVRRTPDEIPLGTHHPDGILILSGTGVKSVSDYRADIIDIAPTVYALLGAELPTYMDGKVLQEAFYRPLDVRYIQSGNDIAGYEQKTYKFSETEEEQVNKRLKELGYL